MFPVLPPACLRDVPETVLMPSVAHALTVLQHGGLLVFVGGTAAVLCAAIWRRMRVLRPLLTWRDRTTSVLPVGPTLLLMVVGGGLGYAQWSGMPLSPSVVVGLPAGSVFWFGAVWIGQVTIVTEYGLVFSASRCSVAWSQIVDYATTCRDGDLHLVLLYRTRDTRSRRRLAVPVPSRYAAPLRAIVRAKLAPRLAPPPGAADTPILDPPDDAQDRP